MASLRLLQFTDMHLYGDPGGELRGVPTLPAFRAAVAHAARRFPVRDAVLVTGDLVQDDPDGYQHVRSVLGASDVPVLCLPGNHDLPDAMARALDHAPFQIGGSYGAGAWHLLLLDTWVANHAGGRLGAEQIAATEAMLERHADRHVLICLHHHPISMRSRWLDEVGLEDTAAFLAMLRRHRNVRGVLWGHVHQALDTFVAGVRFMATPSTCTQFLPRSDEFAIDSRPPAYRVLELTADGSIATEIVWADRRD